MVEGDHDPLVYGQPVERVAQGARRASVRPGRVSVRGGEFDLARSSGEPTPPGPSVLVDPDCLADDDLVEPGAGLRRIAQLALMAERPLDRGLDGVLGIGWISTDHPGQPDEPGVLTREDRLEGDRFLTHRRSTPQSRPPPGDHRLRSQHCSHV